MNICTVQNISKILGGNLIFSDLSFEINRGDRVGIVGRNGTGKTTIFKILSDIEKPDSGEIYLRKGTTIGYLEQLPSRDDQLTVYELLQNAFQDLYKLEKRMKKLAQEMEQGSEDQQIGGKLKEYGMLQEEFTQLGGYEIENQISKVVNGLGITQLINKEFRLLSGGEQTKVGLGVILLIKPDFLLLDEPTNHLDIFAVEWLEEYLKNYSGTIAVISHDRYFLNNIINKIFDLDDGELTVYHGNYSYFVNEKEQRLLAEFAAYQDQQKRIKKMKEAIKRLREWANRANPPNEGLHRRARNMERSLERMEKFKRPNINPQKINLDFEVNERSGNEVVVFENVSKSFNQLKLFEDLNLNVKYGERVAIIGKNGTGKTTIFNLLLGEVAPDKGKIKLGSNVKYGYLSQNIKRDYEGKLSTLEAFRSEVAVTEGEARSILAKFLFFQDSVFKRVRSLSGGELIRLKLAQLMHQEINLLILDEPTNHLDIETREVLEEALDNFPGTILCISHDRHFINKLFNTIYWIDWGEVQRYQGNYEYAREKRKNQSEIVQPLTKKPAASKQLISKDSRKEKNNENEIEKLEGQIEEIESQLLELEQQMNRELEVKELIKFHDQRIELEGERDLLYQKLDQLF